ncbi:sodium/glutamate symporter [Halomonas sp. PR-M31]|uniref:sodium/glutamate symporter n=1 Tax=Halomonas sp. PR-M31 TaxID=1471202 RepID=UPI000B13025C|nr:sodium/glutamate symporter [Halomonas sp. PR-M31]
MSLGPLNTLLLALIVFLVGELLNRRVYLFNKYCIPSPVIGGLLFAIIATLLSATDVYSVTIDTSLSSIFMLVFFTTIGLGASFKLVKLGGKLLVIYWLCSGVLALMQNLIGVSFATLLGLDPLIGVMVGATSMEGGHGAATAFGQTVEELGIDGALSIGLAAATMGLVGGGLLGGPVVRYLIEKHGLAPPAQDADQDTTQSSIDSVQARNTTINEHNILVQLVIIFFCVQVGTIVGDAFTSITGFALPGYVSCMFLAVIIRNLVDLKSPQFINMRCIGLIGNVSLAIFLSMALMSIDLMQIRDLALPLILIVLVQILFVALFGIFIVFRLLGKNFDAAIMVAGFCGHGLGATPNAIANMDAAAHKYGYSPTAFLVVPIVGAFLIDIFALPIIITTINIFS